MPAPALRLAALGLALAGCASAPPPGVADGPPWPAPRPDPALQAAVEALADGFDGVSGVYVRHLPTGREAALRADEAFPTASLVKVPILIGVFERIEAGDLALGTRLTFRDSLRYIEDEGELFAQLQDSSTVMLHSAVEQMLSASDNTASLWLQGIVTGAAVNEWLAGHGFETTRVNSRVDGRRGDWERFGWGQTTPREMAELLRRIVDGQAVSPAADHEMHRLLTRTHWDDEALSAVPPSVQVASKQGAVSRSRSEVAVVHAPSGPYVLAVLTREQADTRWAPDNAGYALIRAVSRAAWAAFEPRSRWRPPAGSERFRF
ncbi:serine hydrolase [Rubrivirga sp. IMCC43871]|uniref:serine hydrolase n=1 Tax=Rubrivirga sp. IMCC43871 TaxID=3391575 RepID=UPI00398FBA1B